MYVCIYIYICVYIYIYIYIHICVYVLPVEARCYIWCPCNWPVKACTRPPSRTAVGAAAWGEKATTQIITFDVYRLLHETPDVTPCRTSPPTPFLSYTSRAKRLM